MAAVGTKNWRRGMVISISLGYSVSGDRCALNQDLGTLSQLVSRRDDQKKQTPLCLMAATFVAAFERRPKSLSWPKCETFYAAKPVAATYRLRLAVFVRPFSDWAGWPTSASLAAMP